MAIAQQCAVDDPDIAVGSFNSIVLEALNKHAPVKSKAIRTKPNTRWYNKIMSQQKRVRKQMERHWRTTGLEIHRQMYTAQRMKVQSSIRSAKKSHFKGLVDDCSCDSRKLYRHANDLLKPKEGICPA